METTAKNLKKEEWIDPCPVFQLLNVGQAYNIIGEALYSGHFPSMWYKIGILKNNWKLKKADCQPSYKIQVECLNAV